MYHLLSDTILGALYALFHSILIKTLGGRSYYLFCFPDKKTEAQRGEMTHQRSRSQYVLQVCVIECLSHSRHSRWHD